MNNEPRTAATRKIPLLWLAVIAILGILMLVVAPGRGANWIQDDGLFLLMSWDVANGFGLSKFLSQSPSYLFHALFMKFGMTEYLHFRYLNYFVILLSALVFFLGMDRRRFRSPVVPLAVAGCLLLSLDSIQNPNSLPLAFFLSGAGCYFFSVDTTRGIRHVLLLLSGALFAVAGFMHAAVVVAMLFVIAIIWMIDPAARRSLLLPGFLVVSLSLWGSYIPLVGMSTLLASPAGHDSSVQYLAHRIGLILIFYLKALLLYLLAVYAYRKRGAARFAAAQAGVSWAVTVFCVASTITYLTGSHQKFPGWLWVAQLPGAASYLLYFALFRWIGERYANAAISGYPGKHARWKTVFRFDAIDCKHIVAVSGLILVPASIAVGSNEAIIQKMAFFAGATTGVMILLWEFLDRGAFSKASQLLVATWLGMFGAIALTYNHPNTQPVISADSLRLSTTPLRGISETARYATALNKLEEAYRSGGCRDKILFSFDYIPMVYYILQHPEPDFGVIRPVMYYPEERIRAALKPELGWCVIDVTGIETQALTDHNHGVDQRAAIRTMVAERSDSVTTIPAPTNEYSGDIRIYVREPRTEAGQKPIQ